MKLLGTLLLIVLLLAAGAGLLMTLPLTPPAETVVDLPSGTGTAAMADTLTRAGVLRSSTAFLLVRLIEGGRLKAGEYRFADAASAVTVYRRIQRGDVYTRSVTIPEGFNLFEIGAALERAGLSTRDGFVAAARSETALVADIAPDAPSLEGYLYPDTYRFSPRATPQQMAAAMVRRFRAEAARLGLSSRGAPPLAHTVTLASLVEKEVHFDDERAMAAGVFQNRLALGMPLQTDPTVAYAALLAGRWRGTIHRSDLQFASPWNTYLVKGLPPGPICSPGAAALRAALHPAATANLYFVADRSGHTQFSQTLGEHAAQVASYRAGAPAAP